jgi:hypothetical protein
MFCGTAQLNPLYRVPLCWVSFCYMTLCWVSFCYMTLYCVSFCQMPFWCRFLLRHDIQHKDTSHNDIQHNNKLNTILSIATSRVLLCWASFMLCVNYAVCLKLVYYAECHYAECRYADCHFAVIFFQLKLIYQLAESILLSNI